MKNSVVPGAVALVVLLFMVPMVGCRQAGGIIVKAHAATMGLQSYRTIRSVTSTLEGKTSEVAFETEFVAPDHHRGKIVVDGGVFEFIIIGDKQYIRDSDPSCTAGVAVVGSGLSKEDTLGLLDSLTDLEELPDEKIDGVDCLHYQGRIDTDQMVEEQKAKLDPAQPRYEEILKELEQLRNMKTEVELWIGKDEYLIRQVKQDTEVPPMGTSSAVVKYYGFNEPIAIEPPETAAGELLPGWHLIDSPLTGG